MPRYLVFWTIDEEEDSPMAAAQAARRHQRPRGIATVFDVLDKATGQAVRLDLTEKVQEPLPERYAELLRQYADMESEIAL
jgi:hypothetical protein